MTKKELAVKLSKLNGFLRPKIALEQYATDSEIAGDVLWQAFLNGDIKNKVIADFGCGSGILGIGALLLGAKKVFFVDIDKEAINVLKDNLALFKKKNYEILNIDIIEFDKKIDSVLENPPFGTKKKHIDKIFLEKALSVANSIYSFHKIESKNFIKKLCGENNFEIKAILSYKMPLKATMPGHIKPRYFVDVGCWVMKKCL